MGAGLRGSPDAASDSSPTQLIEPFTQEKATPAFEPEEASGTGRLAFGPFFLPSGPRTFTVSGDSSDGCFSATLFDEQGDRVPGGDLASECYRGPVSGSKVVRIPKEGGYRMQVDADGPWTIRAE